MAFQTNAIVNIPVTGGTISVIIQGENFSWSDGTTTVQWYEISQNGNGVWLRSTTKPNAQIGQLCATLALSNAYRALSNAAQIAQVTTALQSYYNNQIGLAAGTIQPVLT